MVIGATVVIAIAETARRRLRDPWDQANNLRWDDDVAFPGLPGRPGRWGAGGAMNAEGLEAEPLDLLLDRLNNGDPDAAEQVFRTLRALSPDARSSPAPADAPCQVRIRWSWCNRSGPTCSKGCVTRAGIFTDRARIFQAFLALGWAAEPVRRPLPQAQDRALEPRGAAGRIAGLSRRSPRSQPRPSRSRRAATSSGTRCWRFCPPAHHELLHPVEELQGLPLAADRRAQRACTRERSPHPLRPCGTSWPTRREAPCPPPRCCRMPARGLMPR